MAKNFCLIIAAIAVGALGGCAGQAKRARARADLVQLTAWFPGYYDNQAQIQRQSKAGRPARESLRLAVVPVDAGLIGRHVYYLEESAAGRPRHVTMQRLVSFEVTSNGIVESLWSFTDPTRWLGADVAPELFSALQPGDVRRMLGCELRWTREGGRFTGSDDPSTCRMVSSETGRVQAIDTRMELGPNELAINTHAAGSRVRGGADTYVRFRRNGGPP